METPDRGMINILGGTERGGEAQSNIITVQNLKRVNC